MNKQEAIERLEAVVANYDPKRGKELAEELEGIIHMEPEGWEPDENGIIWQGFRIYRRYTPFGSPYTLATNIVFTSEHKNIFRKRTQSHCERRYINSPRDMLNILKNDIPWEER